MLGEYLMGPLKRYLTQSLASSLSKYISNINIETLGVGGDIILRDLELRLDVLQESLKIPLTFEFSRGFIKELRIQIHWRKLFSHPIHIKVSTIEVILTARSELEFRRLQWAYQQTDKVPANPSVSSVSSSTASSPSRPSSNSPSTAGKPSPNPSLSTPLNNSAGFNNPDEDSGGWLKDALRKIVANATIEISDLVLKYEHANVVLSASFRSLSIYSADPSNGWTVQFQEPQGQHKSIYKACEVKDLTINLDRTAAAAAEVYEASKLSSSFKHWDGPRRRTSSSGSSTFGGDVAFGSPGKPFSSKRHSLRGARGKPVTVEMPILRRACFSLRGKVCVDPTSTTSGPNDSQPTSKPAADQKHRAQDSDTNSDRSSNIKRAASSNHLFMQSAMTLIRKSTSETLLADEEVSLSSTRGASGQTRAGLAHEVDPYKGITCLLPLLCDVDTEEWRASSDDVGGSLDWTPIVISDVNVRNLDISVSEEQFVMLGNLMVLPDDSDGESDQDQGEENADSVAAYEEEIRLATALQSTQEAQQPTQHTQQQDTPPAEHKLQEPQTEVQAEKPASQSSWGSWAWSVVVGESDGAVDSLESEMLSSAAESAKNAELARVAALQLAKQRKRFISVCGIRVDRITISFLLHKPVHSETEKSTKHDTATVSVPVANMGFVQVDVSSPKSVYESYPSPGRSSSKTTTLLEFARINIQGFTLEARVVNDLSENKSHSFMEAYVDVDVVKISRYEDALGTYHDIALWGVTNRDHTPSVAVILDAMPHPWFCWSLFHNDKVLDSYTVHCDKECCVGTSLYRRSDKAARIRAFIPLCSREQNVVAATQEQHAAGIHMDSNMIFLNTTLDAGEIDSAFGPFSCRADLPLIQGLCEFLGLVAAKPQEFSARPSLPHLQQGAAGAALKDLAKEYGNLLRKPRKNIVPLPIDVLCTCPRAQLVLSSTKPGQPPTTKTPSFGFLMSGFKLEVGTNLHLAHPLQVRPGAGKPHPQDASPKHQQQQQSMFQSRLHRDVLLASLAYLLPQASKDIYSSNLNRIRAEPMRKVVSGRAGVAAFIVFLSKQDSKLQHLFDAYSGPSASSSTKTASAHENLDPAIVDSEIILHVKRVALQVESCTARDLLAPNHPQEQPREEEREGQDINAHVSMEVDLVKVDAHLQHVYDAAQVSCFVLQPFSASYASKPWTEAPPLFYKHASLQHSILSLEVTNLSLNVLVDPLDEDLISCGVSLQHLSAQLRDERDTYVGLPILICGSPLPQQQQSTQKRFIQSQLLLRGFPVRLLSSSLRKTVLREPRSSSYNKIAFVAHVGPIHVYTETLLPLGRWQSSARLSVLNLLQYSFDFGPASEEPVTPATGGGEVSPLTPPVGEYQDGRQSPPPLHRSYILLPLGQEQKSLNTYTARHLAGTSLVVDILVDAGEVTLPCAIKLKTPKLSVTSQASVKDGIDWSLSGLTMSIAKPGRRGGVVSQAPSKQLLLASVPHLQGSVKVASSVLDTTGQICLTASAAASFTEQARMEIHPFSLAALVVCRTFFIRVAHIHNDVGAQLQASFHSTNTLPAKKKSRTQKRTIPFSLWRVETSVTLPKLSVAFRTPSAWFEKGRQHVPQLCSPFHAPSSMLLTVERLTVSSVVDAATSFREHTIRLGSCSVVEEKANVDETELSDEMTRSSFSAMIMHGTPLEQVKSFLTRSDLVALATALGFNFIFLECPQVTAFLLETPTPRSIAVEQGDVSLVPILCCSKSQAYIPLLQLSLTDNGTSQLVNMKMQTMDLVVHPSSVYLLSSMLSFVQQLQPKLQGLLKTAASSPLSSPTAGGVATVESSLHSMADEQSQVTSPRTTIQLVPRLSLQIEGGRVFIPVGSTFVDPNEALVFSLSKLTCADSKNFYIESLSLDSRKYTVGTSSAQPSSAVGSGFLLETGPLTEWFDQSLFLRENPSAIISTVPISFILEQSLGTTPRVSIGASIDSIPISLDENHLALFSTAAIEAMPLADSTFAYLWRLPWDTFSLQAPEFTRLVQKRITAFLPDTQNPPRENAERRQESVAIDLDITVQHVSLSMGPRTSPQTGRVLDVQLESVRMIHRSRPLLGSLLVGLVKVTSQGTNEIFTLQDKRDHHPVSVNWSSPVSKRMSVSVEISEKLKCEFTKPFLSQLLTFARQIQEKQAQFVLCPTFHLVLAKTARIKKLVSAQVSRRVDDVPYEEADATSDVQLAIKFVTAGLAIKVSAGTSDGPWMLMVADQLFSQASLHEFGRMEVDVVGVGCRLERSAHSLHQRSPGAQSSVVVQPFDFRCSGTRSGFGAGDFRASFESSEISLSISKEHIAVAMALQASFLELLPPPTRSKNAGTNRHTRYSSGPTSAVPLRNDLEDLKRIYDMGEHDAEYMHPDAGQLVFGAFGSPGDILSLGHVWNEHHAESFTDCIEPGHQLYQKHHPFSQRNIRDWVTLKWQYFEPRQVRIIGLNHPIPIPIDVASAAIHSDSLLENVLECQLCFWDNLHKVYVLVRSFNVPLENDHASSIRKHRALEDFAEAFADLVDLSMEESNDSNSNGSKNGDGTPRERRRTMPTSSQFPVHINDGRVTPSRTWLLRWRAAVTKTGSSSLNVDDRLAVCAALSRSIRIHSSTSRKDSCPVEFFCEVQKLRIAVLHSALLWEDKERATAHRSRVRHHQHYKPQISLSTRDEQQVVRDEEELFIMSSQGFRLHVQEAFTNRRVRVGAALVDLAVQDFGFLTITPFVRCNHIWLTYALVPRRSISDPVHETISLECVTWRWNISPRTVLPFHYGVHAVAKDMQLVTQRALSIRGGDINADTGQEGNHPLGLSNSRPDASLQYVLINSTGRDIWFGQYGTAEVLRVEGGASVSYSWRVSKPYLRPRAKDRELYERNLRSEVFGSDERADSELEANVEELVDAEFERREAECNAFEPLMRFAMESHHRRNEPGTWSRPVNIDTVGVHRRSVVFSSVSKDTSSVFFGSEPSSALWISTQRGENGLQTIVRLLPNHVLVSHVPISLDIQLLGKVYSIEPCSMDSILEEALESDEKGGDVGRTTRDRSTSEEELSVLEEKKDMLRRASSSSSSSSSSSASRFEMDDTYDQESMDPFGFIEEESDVGNIFGGAGRMGLMCPDIHALPTNLKLSEDNQGEQVDRVAELTMELRVSNAEEGVQAEWSGPVPLDSRILGGEPQLVQVPSEGKENPPLWFWIHIRQTMIRSPHGRVRKAWHVIELWPTGFVLNQTPLPLLYKVRLQARQEQLQHALKKNQFLKKEAGLWPAIEGAFTSQQERNEGTFAASAEYDRETERRDMLVGRLGPKSIEALFVDPRKDQVLLFSLSDPQSGDSQRDAQWSSPPLRLDDTMFKSVTVAFATAYSRPPVWSQGADESANTKGMKGKKNDKNESLKRQVLGPSTRQQRILAHRSLHLKGSENGERMVLEARSVEGFASFFACVLAPTRVFNHTDRTLAIQGIFNSNARSTGLVGCVPPRGCLDLDWERSDLVALQVALRGNKEENDVAWSAPVSLEQPDEHIVAMPISGEAFMSGWVAQFLCQVEYDPKHHSTIIRFRNRILIHNATGCDLTLVSESPFLGEDGHSQRLAPSRFPAQGAMTPVSFFCKDPLPRHKRKLAFLEEQRKHRDAAEAEKDGLLLERNHSGSSHSSEGIVSIGKARAFSEWILNRRTSTMSSTPIVQAENNGTDEDQLNPDESNPEELSRELQSQEEKENQNTSTSQDVSEQEEREEPNEEEEEEVAYRLLSTIIRVSLVREEWSDQIVIPSLNFEGSWVQYFTLQVTDRQVACFACRAKEEDGVIHIGFYRESQPDTVIQNQLDKPVVLTRNKTKSGWNLTGRSRESIFGAVIPPQFTFALHWTLFKRKKAPPFEVLRSGTEEDRGDDPTVKSVGTAENDDVTNKQHENGQSFLEQNDLLFAETLFSEMVETQLCSSESRCVFESSDDDSNSSQVFKRYGNSKKQRTFKLAFAAAKPLGEELNLDTAKVMEFSSEAQDKLEMSQVLERSVGDFSCVVQMNPNSSDAAPRRRTRAGSLLLSSFSGSTDAESAKPLSPASVAANESKSFQYNVYIRREVCAWDIVVCPREAQVDEGDEPRDSLPEQVSESKAEMTQEEQGNVEPSPVALKPVGQELPKKVVNVLVFVSDIHVSLFDKQLETIHARARRVEVSFLSSLNELSGSGVKELCHQWQRNVLAARTRWVQVDSYVPESDVPVVLYMLEDEDEAEADAFFSSKLYDSGGREFCSPGFEQARIKRDKVLFGAKWIESVKGSKLKLPMQYLDVCARLAPCAVAVEDALLHRLAESITPIVATLIAQQKVVASWHEKKENKKTRNSSIRTKEEEEEEEVEEQVVYWSSGEGFEGEEAAGWFPRPKWLSMRDGRIFIGRLRISELHVVSTVRTSTLPMFVGVDRTPLRFSAVGLGNIFENMNEMRKELIANYIADAIIGSPALLGSLEILGNPAGFVRSVGAGVYDLFSMPLKAIRHGYGPGGVLRGVARGWTSLLYHFSEGALMSLSGFSSSIARNLDRLSMDTAYAEQRERMRRRRTESSQHASRMATVLDIKRTIAEDEVQDEEQEDGASVRVLHRVNSGNKYDENVHFAYFDELEDFREIHKQRQHGKYARFGTAKGIARGFVGLSQGFVGAATGIVSKPFESAAVEGWGVGSVLKGVGKGLVGVVTKPISGAADFVAQTSGGIMQEAGIGPASGPQIMRKRRALHSMAHPSLRLNWKVLQGRETFVYCDRALLEGRVVELVVTTECIRVFDVRVGKSVCDIAEIFAYKWSQVVALDEPFNKSELLLLRVMHVEEVVRRVHQVFGLRKSQAQGVSPASQHVWEFTFATKHDRREFVKVAVALHRRS